MIEGFPAHFHPSPSVRPGTAGLLIGIECFRVRDSTWMHFASLVTTRIDVELATVQENYLTML